MAAQIQIDQSGKPAGVPGEAREDLDLGTNVTLTAIGGPFAAHQWTIIDKPIDIIGAAQSAALLSSPTASATDVTPIDLAGTYLVQLSVDSGSGLGATADDIARITFYAGPALASDPTQLPRRRPAFQERTEHNVPGAIFANNPRGWAQEWERWFAFIENIVANANVMTFGLAGPYSAATVPGFFEPPRRIISTRTLSAVHMFRRTAGTAGTTRLDVLHNGTSVFLVDGDKPQVDATDGDNFGMVTTTFDPGQVSFSVGEFIDVELETVETFKAGPPEGPEGFSAILVF